ncbi:MAG: YqgE/AlgH family protein [Alphaproteobacteria bacterium]|nr:YqgE/AlgH family protein [Alphaproteobacteria bacterium]
MTRKAKAGGGDGFLNGRLLIAMPTMTDPHFAKAVVLVCHHTPETAMGLVLNRAIAGVSFASILKQLKVKRPTGAAPALTVHAGGPVQASRGFVLHSDDYRADDATLQVAPGIALTATMDVLKALGREGGPARAFFALGYAGWGAGQLEAELQENAWLIGEPDEAIIFGAEPDAKWMQALARIGVDPAMLSDAQGHA